MILINALSWYLMISLAGWLVIPLAVRIFAFLPDRGLSLARPMGLLLWAYTYWILVSLHVLQNDAGGGLFALLCLAVLSALLLRKGGWAEIITLLRSKKPLVIVMESIFLLAFLVWVIIRAAMPEVYGTEKPMELAFINAILRSPAFPPSDPWLSGYAISYYYFGYVMVALLAMMTQLPGAVAFNLGVASWFALTALAGYGILYNLLALRQSIGKAVGSLVTPLLAPFFILIAGNFDGFLEVLHARGIFWSQGADGAWRSGFFSWLNIQELTQPPAQPFTWEPNRPAGIWWWRASRVLQDFALDRSPREVIDEFPMFSYLLGDLHPHVLAMPFALLAVGLALNMYLKLRSVDQQRISLLQWIRQPEFWVTALVLGGLSFLNTWDFPIYLGLFSIAVVLNAFLAKGWHFDLVLDFFTTLFSLGLAGIVIYLPFYLTFASQANGFLPSLIFFTRGAHFWVMFGVLLLPILAWLGWTWRRRGSMKGLADGAIFAVVIIAGLWLLSILYGFLRISADPGLAGIWGAVDANSLIPASIRERFLSPGAWLSMFAFIMLAWGLVINHRRSSEENQAVIQAEGDSIDSRTSFVDFFVLLLVLLGLALVVFPEFFYLRDQFGFRMNTIFKFYFQSWILWGLAAGYASAVLLREMRGAWYWVHAAVWAILIVVSLPYFVFGIKTRTNGFNPGEWTLDGGRYIERSSPDEMAAIRWLREAPYGVVAEAIGGSYNPSYARIATHTGLPTVLGWPGHESQWRGGNEEMGSREADIETLYRTSDWAQAGLILEKYQIRYVYVGATERRDYRPNDAMFQRNMSIVFQNGEVTIYEYLENDSTG